MSIRFRLGYWTVFVGEQPVISCADFPTAWRAVWEVSRELGRTS